MTEPRKPGQPCKTCAHPEIKSINRLLVLGSMPATQIARKYGLHVESINRHKANPKHLTESMKREIMVADKLAREQVVADELNDDRMDVGATYDRLARRVEKLITKAETDGNDGLALASMEGMRKVLRDIATMQGKLAQNLTVQVTLMESVEWIELRAMLETIFTEHPDAGAMFLDMAKRKRLSIAPDA